MGGFGRLAILFVLILPLISAGKPEVSTGVSRIVPFDSVRPSDIGITQCAVEIDIPAGHKLMILHRIYHDKKLDEETFPNSKLCLAYIPNPEGGKYVVEMQIVDPDVMNPEATDKFKLRLLQSQMWMSARNKLRQQLDTTTGPIAVGKARQIIDFKLGGTIQSTDAQGKVTPAEPHEWRIVVLVKVEPTTAREARPEEMVKDGEYWIAYDVDKFGFKESDVSPSYP